MGCYNSSNFEVFLLYTLKSWIFDRRYSPVLDDILHGVGNFISVDFKGVVKFLQGWRNFCSVARKSWVKKVGTWSLKGYLPAAYKILRIYLLVYGIALYHSRIKVLTFNFLPAARGSWKSSATPEFDALARRASSRRRRRVLKFRWFGSAAPNWGGGRRSYSAP